MFNILFLSVINPTKSLISSFCFSISDLYSYSSPVLLNIGGFIGLGLGYGLGMLIAMAIPSFPPASIPLWAVVMALGFSGIVGIIFGILPAAKAANLNPIDALRYE